VPPDEAEIVGHGDGDGVVPCRNAGEEQTAEDRSGCVASRSRDFDPTRSDADFLVSFASKVRTDMTVFLDFKQALEALLNRPVDLVEREAVAESRNSLRRRVILEEAEPVYG
jgi:hypothetical protein